MTVSQVTILQKARNPGSVESFPVLLDASVSNVTVYFTGDSLKFTLHSPSGEGLYSKDFYFSFGGI